MGSLPRWKEAGAKLKDLGNPKSELYNCLGHLFVEETNCVLSAVSRDTPFDCKLCTKAKQIYIDLCEEVELENDFRQEYRTDLNSNYKMLRNIWLCLDQAVVKKSKKDKETNGNLLTKQQQQQSSSSSSSASSLLKTSSVAPFYFKVLSLLFTARMLYGAINVILYVFNLYLSYGSNHHHHHFEEGEGATTGTATATATPDVNESVMESFSLISALQATPFNIAHYISHGPLMWIFLFWNGDSDSYTNYYLLRDTITWEEMFGLFINDYDIDTFGGDKWSSTFTFLRKSLTRFACIYGSVLVGTQPTFRQNTSWITYFIGVISGGVLGGHFVEAMAKQVEEVENRLKGFRRKGEQQAREGTETGMEINNNVNVNVNVNNVDEVIRDRIKAEFGRIIDFDALEKQPFEKQPFESKKRTIKVDKFCPIFPLSMENLAEVGVKQWSCLGLDQPARCMMEE